MLNMQYDLQCLQSLFRRKMLTMPTYPYDMLCPIDGTDGFLHYVEYSPMKISLDYANAYYKMHEAYQNRSRYSSGKNLTWQTVHSCIYDIRNRRARMRIQENLQFPEIVFWL